MAQHRELFALLAGVFAQARSRLTAFAYVGALLAEPGDRMSCWQLAEQAGMPRRGGCRRCWPSMPGTGKQRWPAPRRDGPGWAEFLRSKGVIHEYRLVA